VKLWQGQVCKFQRTFPCLLYGHLVLPFITSTDSDYKNTYCRRACSILLWKYVDYVLYRQILGQTHSKEAGLVNHSLNFIEFMLFCF